MKTILLFLVTVVTLLCGCENSKIEMMDEDISKSIEEFENRKIYTAFDEHTLGLIDDKDLEQAVLDYIYHKIGDNYDNQYLIVTGLSKGFQAVYATWWVEAEVYNGGFNQYFWNSSGEFADIAVDGFREIGAEKTAILLEKAIGIAISELPEMKGFHERGTLEAFSESYEHTRLNDLDDEFYNYEEDLSYLRIKYIRNNIELFVDN